MVVSAVEKKEARQGTWDCWEGIAAGWLGRRLTAWEKGYEPSPRSGGGSQAEPQGGSTQGKHSQNPYHWSVCGASRREVKQTREGLWGSSWRVSRGETDCRVWLQGQSLTCLWDERRTRWRVSGKDVKSYHSVLKFFSCFQGLKTGERSR